MINEFTIRETDSDKGRGLYTKKEYRKEEIVLYLEGNYLPYPTRTSIRIKDDKHIESYEGGHINHHCNPNTEIRIHNNFIGKNQLNQTQPSLVALVVAKRDIQIGEEITFDYETTEVDMAEPFECNCHGRWIRGKYIGIKNEKKKSSKKEYG